MNLYNRTWECNARDADYVCPGYFNTYCPSAVSGIVCGCAGEVWMTPSCREVVCIVPIISMDKCLNSLKRFFSTQLYICEKAASGPDFEFEGDIFLCPEGQLVSVEFGEEITYQCVDETLGKRSAETLERTIELFAFMPCRNVMPWRFQYRLQRGLHPTNHGRTSFNFDS